MKTVQSQQSLSKLDLSVRLSSPKGTQTAEDKKGERVVVVTSF